MNLNQLSYIIEVEKQKSFSIAAKKLNITQSAISQQIQKLEKEIGFQLFDRLSKPILPTPAGVSFLTKTKSVLLNIDQLKEHALTLQEEVKGVLTIGMIPTLAPYLTPLFINDLAELHPDIKLKIIELKTTEIIEAIANREINAGILSTPINTRIKLEKKVLFYEKFLIYISDRHHLFDNQELNLKNILKEEIWLLNEGNCFSDQVDNICDMNINRVSNFEYLSNSIDALIRIVGHKGGLTFLPELATINIPSEQEEMVKKIKGPERVREISLLYSKGEPTIKLIDRLCESIVQNIPKSMREKSNRILIDANIQG